jgi:hypothetical protein
MGYPQQSSLSGVTYSERGVGSSDPVVHQQWLQHQQQQQHQHHYGNRQTRYELHSNTGQLHYNRQQSQHHQQHHQQQQQQQHQQPSQSREQINSDTA